MAFKTVYKNEFELPGVIAAIQEYLLVCDLELLESVSILKLNETIEYYGVCEKPKKMIAGEGYISGYRVRCAINEGIKYPLKPTENALFNSHGDTKRTQQMSIEIYNLGEFCIWLVGSTIHEYIKATDMLGANTSSAEELALDWLNRWRANT